MQAVENRKKHSWGWAIFWIILCILSFYVGRANGMNSANSIPAQNNNAQMLQNCINNEVAPLQEIAQRSPMIPSYQGNVTNALNACKAMYPTE